MASMAYSECIKSAKDFLFSMQNEDGGIKISHKSSNQSGIWTTAESLHAIVTSDCIKMDVFTMGSIIKMIDYLKTKFIVCEDKSDCGYWEIKDGDGASTMTTGHAIKALKASLNQVLTRCNIDKISISLKEIVISEFINEINTCIDKAVKWLQLQQQVDNGWSCTCADAKQESTVLATYYVLLGLNSVGKDYQDECVGRACLYVKRTIQNVLDTKEYSQDLLADILYGYPCLYSSDYLTQSDAQLKEEIMRFIKHHWNDLKKCMKVHDMHHKTIPFINYFPYIALNALLTVEDYTYETKVRKLINYFVSQGKKDGYWSVLKEGKDGIEDSTWVTAEALLVLSQAQRKYQKYYNKIVTSKRIKLLRISSIVFGLTSSVLLLYYFVTSVIHAGADTANMWETILSAILGALGAITSIISIIDIVKKR